MFCCEFDPIAKLTAIWAIDRDVTFDIGLVVSLGE